MVEFIAGLCTGLLVFACVSLVLNTIADSDID